MQIEAMLSEGAPCSLGRMEEVMQLVLQDHAVLPKLFNSI